MLYIPQVSRFEYKDFVETVETKSASCASILMERKYSAQIWDFDIDYIACNQLEKFVSKSVALGPKCSQADGSRTALVVECTKTEGDQPSSQLIFIQIQGIDDRPNFGVSRTDFATKKKTSTRLWLDFMNMND